MNDGQMSQDTRLNRTVNRITFQNPRQSPRYFLDKIHVHANVSPPSPSPLWVKLIKDSKASKSHLSILDTPTGATHGIKTESLHAMIILAIIVLSYMYNSIVHVIYSNV